MEERTRSRVSQGSLFPQVESLLRSSPCDRSDFPFSLTHCLSFFSTAFPSRYGSLVLQILNMSLVVANVSTRESTPLLRSLFCSPPQPRFDSKDSSRRFLQSSVAVSSGSPRSSPPTSRRELRCLCLSPPRFASIFRFRPSPSFSSSLFLVPRSLSSWRLTCNPETTRVCGIIFAVHVWNLYERDRRIAGM